MPSFSSGVNTRMTIIHQMASMIIIVIDAADWLIAIYAPVICNYDPRFTHGE